ncbi:MAG: C_GCAxxG_C_C family protein, partial [Planctomycetes bacterium]|nr:C_GCAxxG_C_C family protein [Planctomycetota bacterium]
MELEEQASIPLAGGMMLRGHQCGMTWGATLAAGAQVYRLFGPGPQAETKAVIVAQRLVESFRTRNNHINCRKVTGLDTSSPTMKEVLYFLIKSVPTGGCFGMAARYAKAAYSEINAALAEKHKTLAPPASCASMLAQKMGVSDMHSVMAAGFAGGIGLSGNA